MRISAASLVRFDAAAAARDELGDCGQQGEYLKGTEDNGEGTACAKHARGFSSDSCPGRTRGGRRV